MLFGQSFIIMVREGLEAILIVGALMAFVVKAGAPEREAGHWGGVCWAALAASLVTAAVPGHRFSANPPPTGEALEGGNHAGGCGQVAVLGVLLAGLERSKCGSGHGFREFPDPRRRASPAGARWRFSAVAFLAVYREGFETVLFYGGVVRQLEGAQSAPSAAITSGIGVGLVVLGAVYWVIQRYGVRLPLKPFFGGHQCVALSHGVQFRRARESRTCRRRVTSVATPLRWAPSPAGPGNLFRPPRPMAAQLLLTGALVAALAWIFWLEPRKT